MFGNRFSLFIALRYLKPKRTFVSVITLIAVSAVTLSVGVFFFVVSLMTGFENNFKTLILGFEPHILVNPRSLRDDWNQYLDEIKSVDGVVAASPYVEGGVILEFNGLRQTIPMRAVPENGDAVEKELRALMDDPKSQGVFDIGTVDYDRCVVGSVVAKQMGIKVGDVISVYSPRNVNEILDSIKQIQRPLVNESHAAELKNIREQLATQGVKAG